MHVQIQKKEYNGRHIKLDNILEHNNQDDILCALCTIGMAS